MIKFKTTGLILMLSFCFALLSFSQVEELQIKYHFEDAGRSWPTTAGLKVFKSKELFVMTDHVSMGPTQKDPNGSEHKARSYIYKDKKEGVMISREMALAELFVKDKLNLFDWKLESKTIQILGYKCQKATAHYRGRDYEAWFTTELPYKAAPWKFHGLPGVVLKARSTDNYLNMEATSVAIRKTKLPIINLYKREKLISWDEFVVIYKKHMNKLKELRKAEYARRGEGSTFNEAPSNIEIIMKGNKMTNAEQREQMIKTFKR